MGVAFHSASGDKRHTQRHTLNKNEPHGLCDTWRVTWCLRMLLCKERCATVLKKCAEFVASTSVQLQHVTWRHVAQISSRAPSWN